jgi:formylglycine-generating enzyme required for sulfatase activity
MYRLIFLFRVTTAVVFLHFFLVAQLLCQEFVDFKIEQSGQEIYIDYTLESNSNWEIQLWVSIDGGASWLGPMKNVRGDIGKQVNAGRKRIEWTVLKDLDNLNCTHTQFKLVATGPRLFEPEMIFVKGGAFEMGSNLGKDNELPIHNVQLSSFYIGKFEVTQKEWRSIMGNSPSYHKDCDQCPVENVTSIQIGDFLKRLNIRNGTKYRLPTEAEWEYAAKGGELSNGFVYSGSNVIDEIAWYKNNSDWKTHEVGRKKSNELGLYDMSGNVDELCSDWFSAYHVNAQINPKGDENGTKRILRGGSYLNAKDDARVTQRGAFEEDKSVLRGFRIACDAE